GLLAHERIEVEDVGAGLVRFEGGALASLLATTAAFPGNATRLQVHGTAGSAWMQDSRLEYFHAADARGPEPAVTGGPPWADADELLALALSHAIYLSQVTGTAIRFADVLAGG